MSALSPMLPGSRSALVKPLAAALAVVLVVASGVAMVVSTELEQQRMAESAQLQAELTSIATRLESAVVSRTVMADALAAFVTSHERIEPGMFDSFAAELLQLEPDVRALQLAPGGVITDVYPQRGNEAAIGLDLTRYKPQADVVERTRKANRFVVGGPLELVQGGEGLIGRLSVWIEPDDPHAGPAGWWGLVQVVIDLPVVLRAAGLDADEWVGQYELRGVDGLGADGAVFVEADLEPDHVLTQTVELPGGEWQLAAATPGTGTLEPVRWHLAGGALLALVAGVLTFQLVAAPATLRRRVDEATSETAATAAHLRSIMNAASDGILSVDPRGVIRATNPSAAALFGRPRHKLEGGHLSEVLPRALQILGHPDATEGGYHLRTEGLDADGQSVPLAVSAAWTADGGLATVIVRDVTEEEAAHDALQRYAEELEELNVQLTRLDQLKRDFVAMASHEMRTPITTVRGLATTLRRAWNSLDDVQRLRCVDGIERQTGRLWQVVTDLLVASDIESGSAHAPTLPVAVTDLISDALAEPSDIGPVHIDAPSELVVAVPVAHVQRILRALVSNAEKYGAGPIDISASFDGGTLSLRVRDHGRGIPPGFEDSLFQRFSQASTGEQRTARGIGLGLAVSRDLARTHGGDLRHERPESGTGACFILEMPARSIKRPERVVELPRDREVS